MSRRASVFRKENPGKPRVRFSDELVFLDTVKENDIEHLHHMLRRASLQVDINGLNTAGLTPLHQAALDGNFTTVRLLIKHGADVNRLDEDHWTPLHAACAEGHSKVVRYLLKKGADTEILTEEGERPIDLCDATDFATISIILNHKQNRTELKEVECTDSENEQGDAKGDGL